MTVRLLAGAPYVTVTILLLIMAFAGIMPRTALAQDHPTLNATKRADRTEARIGDTVRVTIDVNGSGVPVPVYGVVAHPADILIMMDSSESYFQEIMDMQAEFTDLVNGLSALGLNLTFGFITFGNSKSLGECPINTDGTVNAKSTRQLTTNITSITEFINSLIAWGNWEPWGDAIYLANNWAAWRTDAYKISILVTDEPSDEGRRVPGPLSRTSGSDYDGTALWTEVSKSRSDEIMYITIDSGSLLTTTQLTKIASQTGGMYYDFSHALAEDFVEVINSTITEVVLKEQRETAGYDVVLTDTVSSQVELVQGSFNMPPTSQTVNPDGSVTLEWSLGDVKYNESVRIKYNVKAVASGEILTNTEGYVDYVDWEGNAASIVLPDPTVHVPHPAVESCNASGVETNVWAPAETVYANGNGYAFSSVYDVYVVEDVLEWTEGMDMPARVPGTVTEVTSDAGGNLAPTVVWSPPLKQGKYDVVVDVNGNGKYEVGVDALDDEGFQVTGGFSVPELTLGTVPSIIACFVVLALFRIARTKRNVGSRV